MATKPRSSMKTKHEDSSLCWATLFGSWVRTYGVVKLASDLGVEHNAVRHWIHGRAVPRQPMMVDIIRLAEGRLTYADLFAHIESVKPKGDASAGCG